MKEIAGFAVIEELGTGNHGRCYVVEPSTRLRGVADRMVLKVLARLVTDEEFARVTDQMRDYVAVESANLVPVYDIGHGDAVLYYAMAHCPDGSLSQPATSLAPTEITRAVADAARGAHDLHEAGIVHRNIKPANILLDGGGGRLSDIGLVRQVAPGMTSTGVGPTQSVDALEFLEPGVLSGERASRLTDIWSLGVSLHRALTATGVYPGLPESDPLAALQHILHARPTVSDQLAGPARAAIERCLAGDRDQRFPTAAALADALDGAGIA